MDQVRQAFDAIASEYDAERRWIVPGYDDFYQAAVMAADWPGEQPRILDIGAGTGALSALLLKRYPRADLTLMQQWVLHWRGLGAIMEIVPVVTGAETRAVVAPFLDPMND